MSPHVAERCAPLGAGSAGSVGSACGSAGTVGQNAPAFPLRFARCARAAAVLSAAGCSVREPHRSPGESRRAGWPVAVEPAAGVSSFREGDDRGLQGAWRLHVIHSCVLWLKVFRL